MVPEEATEFPHPVPICQAQLDTYHPLWALVPWCLQWVWPLFHQEPVGWFGDGLEVASRAKGGAVAGEGPVGEL
jgi:hypothetical protein